MITKLFDMNGIPVYLDEYVEDNKIMKGHKGHKGDESCIYYIANPKTANILYEIYKKKLRSEKLKRILNV